MTRRDALQCVHEPFGDAFYFGPERLSKRFMNDTATLEASGSSDKTYEDIYSFIMEEGNKEVRPFLVPLNTPRLASSPENHFYPIWTFVSDEPQVRSYENDAPGNCYQCQALCLVNPPFLI